MARLRCRRQILDDFERGRIGPVQVIKKQDRWRLRRAERFKQAAHRLLKPLFALARVNTIRRDLVAHHQRQFGHKRHQGIKARPDPGLQARQPGSADFGRGGQRLLHKPAQRLDDCLVGQRLQLVVFAADRHGPIPSRLVKVGGNQ